MKTWGRAPSAGRWMPGGPRASAAAIAMALVLTISLGQLAVDHWAPTQQYYLSQYVRSTLADALQLPPLRYQLLSGTNDIIEGHWANASIRAMLHDSIYGAGILELFARPLACGAFLAIVLLRFAIPKDKARSRERRQGRYLRGTREVNVKTFNRELKGDGIRFPQKKGPAIRIPEKLETRHIVLASDSGTGKSQVIEQMLDQVADRGETAVVLDVSGDFITKYYDPDRGDVILDPEHLWGAYWTPADEILSDTEALTLAQSMIPSKEHETNSFFTDSARTVLAFLLTFRPNPDQLVAWLLNKRFLQKLIDKTIYADVLPADAPGQRSGVMSPLNRAAECLQLCPREEDGRGRWSATEWAKDRKGWVFILSRPMTRERLRPLHTLWLDLIILRLMGTRSTKKVWLFLDEVRTLNKLWQLETGLAEGRKYHIAIVLAMQGISQLQALYGRVAETMLSQSAITLILRTKFGAEWASKMIGEVEKEYLKPSQQDGIGVGNTRSSYVLERETKPAVMPSQINGLEDMTGYIKILDLLCPIDLPIVARAARHPAFVPRPPVVPTPTPKLPVIPFAIDLPPSDPAEGFTPRLED